MIGFRMKKFAIGFCSLFFVAPVFAQVALKSDTPSILFWTPQQQVDGYRNIENIYKVVTVKRGAKVHPLPKSKKQLSPAWEYGNRQWTVDSYMKENRTSGVLVLKDGKIVLERYGLGRGPQERWTSFSVAKSLTSTLGGAALQHSKNARHEDMVRKIGPEIQ